MSNSSRSYLLQALYDWLIDQYLTPYVVIEAEAEGVSVPVDLAQNGSIVFNVSPEAVGDLDITKDAISFQASFSGVVRNIYAPIPAVMAIYAQENGSGMMFSETGVPGEEDGFKPGTPPVQEAPSDRPMFRLVTDTDVPPEGE